MYVKTSCTIRHCTYLYVILNTQSNPSIKLLLATRHRTLSILKSLSFSLHASLTLIHLVWSSPSPTISCLLPPRMYNRLTSEVPYTVPLPIELACRESPTVLGACSPSGSASSWVGSIGTFSWRDRCGRAASRGDPLLGKRERGRISTNRGA